MATLTLDDWMNAEVDDFADMVFDSAGDSDEADFWWDVFNQNVEKMLDA